MRTRLPPQGRQSVTVNSDPFDAVLIVAFGGPQGLADVRPFLANVLRGRRVSPNRVEEVVTHYEHFGGVSPITACTFEQAEGVRVRLAAAGHALPVHVGMRNWHPFLIDTLERMADQGVRRVVGLIASPFHSYSSCQQYRENVADARAELQKRRGVDIEVTYTGSWFDHQGFVAAVAAHVGTALARLPPELAEGAQVIFTAHSLPMAMAERCQYREQLATASAAVAGRLGREWVLAYQSRSGRPEDLWLEPDVCDYLRTARAKGMRAAVLCPIGFLCDHIEVLYDLDEQAAGVARDIGLAVVRAEAPNAAPVFLDALTDIVLQTLRRYSGRPLPLVALGTRGAAGTERERPGATC